MRIVHVHACIEYTKLKKISGLVRKYGSRWRTMQLDFAKLRSSANDAKFMQSDHKYNPNLPLSLNGAMNTLSASLKKMERMKRQKRYFC